MEVDRLSAEGEGVSSWKGRALFVPGALPGEQVRLVPRLRLLARRVARKLAPEGSALRALLRRGRTNTPGRAA